MNATADGGQNPERPGPGAPGLPLSAPVAATVLSARELSAHAPEPGERPRPDIPAPARPPGHGPRPGAHAPAAPTAAQLGPAAGSGRDPAPYPPTGRTAAADWSAADVPEDPQRALLREHLDAVRAGAASASSWLEASEHYVRLLNRDGVVPVTARFTRDDIEFLGRAREEVLGFAELGLRLLELHAPLDAGGISTDPSSPILRCRSCMWRWPCPTFRMLTDALSHLPPPGPPPAR